MCTLIFFPAKDGVHFASLRDESILRKQAITPQIITNETGLQVVMPIDGEAGGSWIGASNEGVIMVLMNGAFVKHKHSPPYAKSRGLILKEMLLAEDFKSLWATMDLTNIEPFSIFCYNHTHFIRLTWTSEQKVETPLNSSTAHVFSSCTLYNTEMATFREQAINSWMEQSPKVDRASTLLFLQTAFEQSTTGFFLNRETVKTISYTYLKILGQSPSKISFHYTDLLTNQESKTVIDLG